ncbi:MAG: alginate export family protein [Bacteroidota bacterium]|nr:MAG: alginate export family protein [Bacteroidota bacterium]
MRKHYLISCLSFLTLIPFFDVFGQTTLIDAEFRPRLEYREGFRKPLVDTLSPMLVTVQRTRLNFEYSSALLNARLSIQDAHVWGNSNTKTNASLLSLYEAWFEYLITSGVSVKAGRQPLRYDDNRIFASPNWSSTGIVHDLLLLQYKTTLLQVHSGFAYNNAKDTLVDIAYSYANINTYKYMAFGWVSVQPFKNTSFSTMLLAEGFENPTNYETNYGRFTLGTYLNYESDLFPLSGSITAHFQQGNDMIKTVSSGGYAKLIAHFYASKASYEFAYKYTATLGIDFYSGSATTIDANKSNTYNRLYGALHNYNGYMEYYTKLPAQGLVNYYGSFNYFYFNRFTILNMSNLYHAVVLNAGHKFYQSFVLRSSVYKV